MFTKICNKKQALSTLMLAALVTGLGCGDVSAKSPDSSTKAAAPTENSAPASNSASVALDPNSLGGDFSNGYQFGQRNGTLLVNRLKQRTTDLEGCDGIPALETALLRVTRAVRPPLNSSDGFVAGFYSGYKDTVRSTLSKLRKGCDLSIYSDGAFAGQFFGAVACQIQSLSVEAYAEFTVQPLYAGWSGGSDAVQASCLASLQETIQTCTDGSDVSTQLQAAFSLSCSDSAAFLL